MVYEAGLLPFYLQAVLALCEDFVSNERRLAGARHRIIRIIRCADEDTASLQLFCMVIMTNSPPTPYSGALVHAAQL